MLNSRYGVQSDLDRARELNSFANLKLPHDEAQLFHKLLRSVKDVNFEGWKACGATSFGGIQTWLKTTKNEAHRMGNKIIHLRASGYVPDYTASACFNFVRAAMNDLSDESKEFGKGFSVVEELSPQETLLYRVLPLPSPLKFRDLLIKRTCLKVNDFTYVIICHSATSDKKPVDKHYNRARLLMGGFVFQGNGKDMSGCSISLYNAIDMQGTTLPKTIINYIAPRGASMIVSALLQYVGLTSEPSKKRAGRFEQKKRGRQSDDVLSWRLRRVSEETGRLRLLWLYNSLTHQQQ